MKPTKKRVVKDMMNYSEMIHFIEDKYKIDTRDFANRFNKFRSNNEEEAPYLDFWHWLLDHCFYEVSNPSSQYLNVTEILNDSDTPDWVRKIVQMIYDEFKDDLDSDGGFDVWIEW